ncbi:hypothetical protein HPB49_020287 [Dermacentor silvarum]|uniref:Uncharacterized protein n=1 Tax=Dermacentor silvarum TaxID=543639 RepID=A0ACB8DK06_DERSI|nr:hypothetical protein HPB49_020287 [Dermacentor silvarum]
MAEYSRKVRSKKEKSGETIAYSEAAMRHNGAVLEYCRTSLAALSGCTAGILGLTGLWGFLFYFATCAGAVAHAGAPHDEHLAPFPAQPYHIPHDRAVRWPLHLCSLLDFLLRHRSRLLTSLCGHLE